MEVKQKEERLGKRLNDKIKELLLYVGFASSIISVLAYMIATVVMIVGFKSDLELQNRLMFAVLGAIVGLVITFSLRSQGIAFAKLEDESQRVMREYREALNKKKKEKELKDITHYMIISTIKDIIIKGILIIVTTTLIIDIFAKGNGDWSLIWLAIANLMMFTGFGLVALAKTYDKYIEEHIPVIKERTQLILIDQAKKEKLPFADLQDDYGEGGITFEDFNNSRLFECSNPNCDSTKYSDLKIKANVNIVTCAKCGVETVIPSMVLDKLISGGEINETSNQE